MGVCKPKGATCKALQHRSKEALYEQNQHQHVVLSQRYHPQSNNNLAPDKPCIPSQRDSLPVVQAPLLSNFLLGGCEHHDG